MSMAISRHHTQEDVFVHQTATTWKNISKVPMKLGDGETGWSLTEGRASRALKPLRKSGQWVSPSEGKLLCCQTALASSFYIHGLVPKSQGPKGAKDISLINSRAAAKALLQPRASATHLPITPKTNKWGVISPLGKGPPAYYLLPMDPGYHYVAPGLTIQLWVCLTAPKGHPQWGVALLRLSHLRDQSTTPSPRH